MKTKKPNAYQRLLTNHGIQCNAVFLGREHKPPFKRLVWESTTHLIVKITRNTRANSNRLEFSWMEDGLSVHADCILEGKHDTLKPSRLKDVQILGCTFSFDCYFAGPNNLVGKLDAYCVGMERADNVLPGQQFAIGLFRQLIEHLKGGKD